MTQLVDVTLPKLGESIVGATVVQWLKKEGDLIRLDEPLLEVSTDKINSEIPSPVAGILRAICAKEETEVVVGELLGIIEISQNKTLEVENEGARSQTVPEGDATSGKETVFSPAVLRLAQTAGISIDVLQKIEGTGEGGRISKRDVERYIETRSQVKQPPICPQKQALSSEKEDRIKMTGMRKAIADNMVRSFYAAPHASVIAEADVTDLLKLITKEKELFKQTHGVKLTITPFLIQALTRAIQQFPMLNASLEDETIIMKRYVNVGIAVNVDKGLLVPVIKNCQERNLVSLAKALADLSTRAREGKLMPDDITDGTVTLTNFGMTGALIGTPIIRYPEVAIIGAGAIQKRVVVREDESLAVRDMVYLTLTFDHRIIDGIYGCHFLSSFKKHLESVSSP